MIVRYSGNYPIEVYKPLQKRVLPAIGVLRTIQLYYKITIPFQEELIHNLHLSDIAALYISQCRKSGFINRKVLEYIRTGKI